MKIVAVLPPSDQIPAQEKLLQGMLKDHEIRIVTSGDALAPLVPEAEILVSTAFVPITGEMIRNAPRLRFLQVAGVGVDHVDMEAARAAGITVANVAAANAVSVAEHVVMVALAMTRDLCNAHAAMRAGQWSLPQWMSRARELAGLTVGIVGMGRIGREVARRLLPFGVTIVYYDVQPLDQTTEDELGVTLLPLDDLLAAADIVTVHVPLNENTYHLFDATRFARMKPGSYFINAARAEIVDENALVDALKTRLGGAAIDVFSPEPPPPDHPLFSLPNVLLTPHGAGVTVNAQQRIAQGAIQNVLRYLDGRPLADVVIAGTR